CYQKTIKIYSNKVSFILRFFAKNATLFWIFLRENERKIYKMHDFGQKKCPKTENRLWTRGM
ncbi:MAG: hypothetical protein ACI3XW_11080, partial [Butyricicoccus sp.]